MVSNGKSRRSPSEEVPVPKSEGPRFTRFRQIRKQGQDRIGAFAPGQIYVSIDSADLTSTLT